MPPSGPAAANPKTACNDAGAEIGDLPAVADKAVAGMFIFGRPAGAAFEISLAGPPGRRKTVESVGVKYRTGFAALP